NSSSRFCSASGDNAVCGICMGEYRLSQVDEIDPLEQGRLRLHPLAFKIPEIEQLRIAKLRWRHAQNALRDHVEATGMHTLPVVQHALDFLALHDFLAAAQIARNDRKLAQPGVGGNVLLLAVRKWPNHDVAT